jgi:hypothetical protein
MGALSFELRRTLGISEVLLAQASEVKTVCCVLGLLDLALERIETISQLFDISRGVYQLGKAS